MDKNPDEVLQRVIDAFKLDMTVEELARRQRTSGMELVDVKESWGTPFSSVVEVTHRLTNPDGSPRLNSDGTPEAPISRDYFTKRDRGAVAVLLYSPKTNEVVLIQEPRPMGLLAGTGGLMLEVSTGGIGKNDKSPIDAARREAEKESGLPILAITPVAMGVLASAGRIDERMSLFAAEVDLSNLKEKPDQPTLRKIEADPEETGGKQGHAEFIRTRIVSYRDFFDLTEAGQQSPINAATWALAIWFKANHRELASLTAGYHRQTLAAKLGGGNSSNEPPQPQTT